MATGIREDTGLSGTRINADWVQASEFDGRGVPQHDSAVDRGILTLVHVLVSDTKQVVAHTH